MIIEIVPAWLRLFSQTGIFCLKLNRITPIVS